MHISFRAGAKSQNKSDCCRYADIGRNAVADYATKIDMRVAESNCDLAV
jgi:hypothetical protein